MTKAMTERDKKLLYMLGFIVIIFLFIIIADRPLFRKIKATNKEIETAEETYDTMKMKLERMSIVQGYRDQIEGKVDRYADRYYRKMDSTEVDELLTGYVLGLGLKAVDLYIDMQGSAVNLVPYQYSEAAKQAAENGTAASTGNPDEAQVEAFTDSLSSGAPDIEESSSQVYDTTLSGVYAAQTSLTTYGSEQRLKALLDKLYGDQSIRVISYSWGDSTGGGLSFVDGQLVELSDRDRQLKVSLQVLMYDDDAYVDKRTQAAE